MKDYHYFEISNSAAVTVENAELLSPFKFTLSELVDAVSKHDDYFKEKFIVWQETNKVSSCKRHSIRSLEELIEHKTLCDRAEEKDNLAISYKLNKLSDPKDAASPVKEKDAINPSHYQGFFQDYQWLETMQFLPTYQDVTNGKFEAAVELQVRKYLDRLGQKDEVLQELCKSMWYLRFLIAYKKAGRPILVEEVESIIEGI